VNKSLLLFFLLISVIASAETNPHKIYIDSDDLLINQTKQQVNFTGKVILWFDDMVLKTTNLEIHYKIINNKKTFDYIIIPSKLTAKKQSNQEIVIANSAKYFVEKKELELIGEVIVYNNDGIIQTDKLVYYAELRNIDY
jgi:lipopolysaccharide transport protein LptA